MCGLPHFLEDQLALEGLALALWAPNAQDERHLSLRIKTTLLHHVVFHYMQLQPF